MAKEDLLDNIPITRQHHPMLGPDSPFFLAWEYRETPETSFRGDMHYALQMCIVIHGKMEVLYQNYRREYGPGEAEWTMFWEPHAFRFTGRRNFVLAVNIDIDFLGNCDPFGYGNWLLPFVTAVPTRYCPEDFAARRYFQDNARRLFHLWSRKPDNWKLAGWFLIHELILKAAGGIDSANTAPHQSDLAGRYRCIKPAVALVRDSRGRAPSLSEAAAACNYSPGRFGHLFREIFGIGFGKFALRSRLASAAKELKQNRHTIEDIAARWGFYDSSHFLHAFQSLYGCTPSQYQKEKR